MTDSTSITDARMKALLARLARAEGQIRGIRRMIQEGAPCESVMQQLAAARTALNKASCEMIACSIARTAAAADDPQTDLGHELEELTRLLTRYG